MMVLVESFEIILKPLSLSNCLIMSAPCKKYYLNGGILLEATTMLLIAKNGWFKLGGPVRMSVVHFPDLL